jgi:hypothetical protein
VGLGEGVCRHGWGCVWGCLDGGGIKRKRMYPGKRE